MVKKSHFVAAWFCGALSLMAMAMFMVSGSESPPAVFYSFLPMCFAYIGFTTIQMDRELQELKSQVAELRKQTGEV